MSSICLSHDLGHPPFGHGGEVALNFCMRDYGGFEGNGQTLRILSSLDKYTEKHGLNPTRRLLLGVLKYPASYNDTVYKNFYEESHKTNKWLFKAKTQKPPKCYLDTEKDVVDFILCPLDDAEKIEFTKIEEKYDNNKRIHNKPKYKSFDTSIMELADDISYSLHDLEDAISLGMITSKDWENHNRGKEIKDLFQTCDFNRDKVKKELFSEHSYIRKKMIGELVHQFITHTEIKETGLKNVQNPLIKWNAYMKADYKKLLDHIFTLVKLKVIKSSNVQQLEFKGQKMIVELFEALHSDPQRLLPSSTIKKLQSAKNEGSSEERVICDFIAGMTDEYATRLYEKLFYPHKGSIFDRL